MHNVTVKDIAKMIGTSPRVVYVISQEKKFPRPVAQIGQVYLYDPATIRKFFDDRGFKPRRKRKLAAA